VAPYRLLKTRLLNAGHSAVGYLGTLAGGYLTTSDVMQNPVFVDYLTALMRDEIAGVLPPVPGIDVDAYQRTLLDRFANPRISDQLSRLCARGSTKMPAYLLPSLLDAQRRGQRSPLLTLAVAAWFRYLRGHDLHGNPIDVHDTNWDRLRPLATAEHPRTLLAERAIFGHLGDNPQFTADLQHAIHALDTHGPITAMRTHLAAERRAAA
jgi:fructuronate reductase/mannitol 2-dehydrogenase